MEAALTNKALGFITPEGRERMAGWGTYGAVLGAIEAAVTSSRYLVGDRFSAADVYVGSQIGFGLMFNSIEKRPAFERYWQGLTARPAAVRARAIDDGLIAQGKQSA
jgi:glutathione S-transferase